MVFPSRSRVSWLPGTVSVVNAGEAWHNWERKEENRNRDWGASRKSILVDVRAEMTVEVRCILMMETVRRAPMSFKIL